MSDVYAPLFFVFSSYSTVVRAHGHNRVVYHQTFRSDIVFSLLNSTFLQLGINEFIVYTRTFRSIHDVFPVVDGILVDSVNNIASLLSALLLLSVPSFFLLV